MIGGKFMKRSFTIPNGSLIEFGFDENTKRYFLTASNETMYFESMEVLEDILSSLRQVKSDEWMIALTIKYGRLSISHTHIHCYGSNCTYENYIYFGYINRKFANYMADCLETLLDTFRETVKS